MKRYSIRTFIPLYVLFLSFLSLEGHSQCAAGNDLTTAYNNNNGQDGIMFDIYSTPANNVTIRCFEGNFDGNTHTIEVYYKAGTHVGFENNGGAWTLAGSANVNTNPPDNATYVPVNVDVTIPCGQTYGFYVTTTDGTFSGSEYTNGTGVGNVAAGDANLELLEGTGKDYAFNANYTPRVFNGTVYYDVGSSASIAPTGATASPDSICAGQSSTLEQVGGTLNGSDTWEWYSGSCGGTYVGTGSPITVSPATTTTYYVRAEGACGATTCESVTVTVEDESVAPTGANATPNPICGGDVSSLSVSGGSLGSGATWEWYSGSCGGTAEGSGSSINVSPATTTTYYVRAEGSCNTTTCESVTVTVNDVTANPVTTDETCGDCDGEIDVQGASGGTAPYQYSIDNGASFQGSSLFTGLCAGTYDIVVEDDIGCQFTATATINNIPGPTDLTVDVTEASCGANDGVIDITGVTGGTTPYQYQVDGGGFSGTTSYTGLAPGSHTVEVQDDNGCIYQETVNVPNAGAPAIDTILLTHNTCNGSCDGEIEVQAIGGTTPYQYSVDNGATFQGSNVFTGLCANTYDVVVLDDNGCQISDQATITEPAPVSFDTTITDLQCFQDGTGEIDIHSVTGGTAPYQYSNDNGATFQGSGSFTGLMAGTYDLVVEDANGCQGSMQVDVNEPAELQFDTTITDLQCFQDGTGEIEIHSVTGGTAPYQYSNDNGATFQGSGTFTGLSAGTYDLMVEDANGCQATMQVNVNEPAALNITTSSVNANCSASDGSASVDNVTGGTTPYSYQWDDPSNQTTATATNLATGDYEVVVTDDNGCTITDTVSVGNNSGQTLAIDNVIDVSCNGGCDGEVHIAVNGGTAPFSYQWDDPSGQTTQNATGLCAGTYQVLVTDDNGCQDSISATVNEPSPVQVDVVSDTIICISGTATLSANASGGTPGYTYHWDQGLGTGQVHNVSPGSNTVYEVYAEDANGCTSDPVTVRVDLYPPLNVTATGGDSICPGESIQLNASGNGGIGSGYSYTWSNGDAGTSTVVSPNSTTTYGVALEDGCETPAAVDSVTVVVNDLPDVQLQGSDLSGCAPVQATLINATDPSEVGGDCVWDFGDGNQAATCDTVQHTFTEPGCYDVTLSVRSPEGCVDSTTVSDMVCVRPYPVADFSFNPEEGANVQDPEFSFSNLSTGAVEYEWDFGGLAESSATHPDFSFPSQEAGVYEVCLAAENSYGCRDSTCRQVTVEGQFILYVPNAFTPDDDGLNDEFGPVVQGADETDYRFMIFDRWGQVVFEGHHPEERWDGSVNGSGKAKADVYVWKLATKNKYTGEGIERTGHVTVVR